MIHEHGRIVVSALSTFTNAAAAAIGDGDPAKLRDLARQCRKYLRTYPNEPFFTVFETLFEKSSTYLEISEPRKYLERDIKALKITKTLMRFGPLRITQLLELSRVGRVTFDDRFKKLHKMGLMDESTVDGKNTFFAITPRCRDVIALIP